MTLSDRFRITAEINCEDFNVFLEWLNTHDPDWRFSYNGDRDTTLNWYKVMSENPHSIQSWHLQLTPKAAMLAKLTWNTWTPQYS